MYEHVTARAGKRAAGEEKSSAPHRAETRPAPLRAGQPELAHRLSNLVDPVVAGSAAPPIQRVVLRGDGARQHNKDLVDTVIGFRDFGVTPGKINTEEFPGGNAAQAVVGPQLRATPAPNNKTEVRVAAEPANIVDYRMELPAAAPWQRNMPKGDAIPYVEMLTSGYPARLQTLRESATDQTAFRVAGAPSDVGFANLVETHEDHHVADLWLTTEEILEPWDANIRQLREADVPITADDEPTARAALYDAVGGTPAQIGQQMADDMRDKGNAFHQTDAGGSPKVADVTTSTNPNTLTFTWRHPLG